LFDQHWEVDLLRTKCPHESLHGKPTQFPVSAGSILAAHYRELGSLMPPPLLNQGESPGSKFTHHSGE